MRVRDERKLQEAAVNKAQSQVLRLNRNAEQSYAADCAYGDVVANAIDERVRFRAIFPRLTQANRCSVCATNGSGKGAGIGGGGSVREAGGKFAEMEVAREEQYFRKLVSNLHISFVIAEPIKPYFTASRSAEESEAGARS